MANNLSIAVTSDGMAAGHAADLKAVQKGALLPLTLDPSTAGVFDKETQPRASIRDPKERREQAKDACEDHVLGGIIPDGNGKPRAVFAALADGVSSKTLYAERGSALACLAAFELSKALTCDPEFNKQFTECMNTQDQPRLFDLLMPRLTEIWTRYVDNDLKAIAAYEQANPGFEPVGWASLQQYEKLKQNPAYLRHSTTLLFAYHDGTHGFLLKIGDGGVVGVDRDGKVTGVVGFSAIDNELQGMLSTKNTGKTIQPHIGGDISLAFLKPETEKVILVSDGPEESLLNTGERPEAGKPLPPTFARLVGARTRSETAAVLIELAKRPGAKFDDFSISVLNRDALKL